MEVFDGQQVASLSMGKVCAGAELTFLSSSNFMTVVFKSDTMITNTGFYALYNTILQGERQNGGYPDTHLTVPCPVQRKRLLKTDLNYTTPGVPTSAK